ncbi:SLC13 family permease [Alkaliphilus transvaalensis]|uniref:SLC13 family permease n=1 Tax=Alkaliphilus transvaalensis TaxID=114628 RepID=UPI00047C4F2E|nr:SLC13 family permease [Alkaliphilus transvaalensis]
MLQQIMVFIILILSLSLFINGKIRYDLVALMALIGVTLIGVIIPDEAFLGFGHPAVVTVVAVLVISKGLLNAGVADFITKKIKGLSSRVSIQIGTLVALVILLSSFMNNVGALALLMPVALKIGKENNIRASVLLMPLSFGSLLGGLITLIGTPPNIIIATFRGQNGMDSFKMFDFAPVGVGIALVGGIFITLIGWRLLPKRKSITSKEELFDIEGYLTEVWVTTTSKVINQTLKGLGEITDADFNIVGLVRDGKKIPAPSSYEILHKNDILIVKASSNDIKKLINTAGLSLLGRNTNIKVSEEVLRSEEITLIEAVVRDDSLLNRKNAYDLNLRRQYGVNLIAVSRQGEELKGRLSCINFKAGDIVLLQVQENQLQQTMQTLGCLPLAERDIKLGDTKRSIESMIIFFIGILLTTFRILPVQIALSMSAIAIILVGALTIKEAYDSINWSIVILLGAMIPVGQALERSGGAETIAVQILRSANHLSARLILIVVMVLTLLLTNIINNAAAAVLMAPIALNISQGLGVSADPFLMAVAIGASSAYLTPIGHQSNTLVMGPGGYHFSDFWRMGLPLSIITVIVGLPLILLFWPL